MERGFKYRIYPNASQRDQIARTLGCCRFVYNRALDVKKSAYAKTGKTVSWAELSRMLPAWKRDSETSWLAQADSMALQQSVRDLDRAYKNFFRRVREGGKPGFPKFKSRRHSRQSYRTNGGKVVDRNHIALPKLGTVRAKVSRPLQGRFMSVTVSLDAAGRYFATFLCTDVPAKEASATDREVGIDLGVETLATLSDGTKIGNPRHLKKYERKLAREQRRLSRRKGARRDEKPSDRYLKQRELDATVRKQAEADRYAAEQKADAELYTRTKNAEAAKVEAQNKSDADLYSAQKTAEGVSAKAKAEAEATRLKGEADGAAEKAHGEGVAAGIKAQTEAYNGMENAYLLANRYIDVMPEVAEAVAKPLASVDSIKMYGDGNATKLVRDTTGMVDQVTSGLKDATGIDLTELLSSFHHPFQPRDDSSQS